MIICERLFKVLDTKETANRVAIEIGYKYRIDNAYNSLYNILIATNNYKKLAKYRKNQILTLCNS